jgi:hypothetical protein
LIHRQILAARLARRRIKDSELALSASNAGRPAAKDEKRTHQVVVWVEVVDPARHVSVDGHDHYGKWIYQYLQKGSIWLYGTITPQKETRVVMMRGFTSEA